MLLGIAILALAKLSLTSPADYQSLTGAVPYKIAGLGGGAAARYLGAPRGEDVAFLLEAMAERSIACENINTETYIKNDDIYRPDIGNWYRRPFPSRTLDHSPIWQIANYSFTPMRTDSLFKCCAWDESVFLVDFLNVDSRDYVDKTIVTNLFWGTKNNLPPFERYNADYYFPSWDAIHNAPLLGDRIFAFYCDLRDNEAIPFYHLPHAAAGRTYDTSSRKTTDERVVGGQVTNIINITTSETTNSYVAADTECFARAHGSKSQYEVYYADYDPAGGALPTGKEGTLENSWPLTITEDYEVSYRVPDGGFCIRFPVWFADRVEKVKCYAVMQFYREMSQYETSPSQSEDYESQRFIVIEEVETGAVTVAENGGFAQINITTDLRAEMKQLMHDLVTGRSAKEDCDVRMASLPFPEAQEKKHPDTTFVNSVTVVKKLSLLRFVGIAKMRYHARIVD